MVDDWGWKEGWLQLTCYSRDPRVLSADSRGHFPGTIPTQNLLSLACIILHHNQIFMLQFIISYRNGYIFHDSKRSFISNKRVKCLSKNESVNNILVTIVYISKSLTVISLNFCSEGPISVRSWNKRWAVRKIYRSTY